MFSMNASNGIVRIFDRNNEITFYPSTFRLDGKTLFCYNVETNCNEKFFEEVFSTIYAYKTIKLDAKNKKYNFNLVSDYHYGDILRKLDYLEMMVWNLFFKSYKTFGVEIEEELLQFVEI